MLNQVARSLARTLGRSARQVLQSAVAPPFHFTSESGAEFASFYRLPSVARPTCSCRLRRKAFQH